MPGVSTLKDVVSALELGADIIKIFPGELFGPKIIKAFHGPVPQAQLMPTGGVSVENVGEWIRAGAVAVGAGGSLTGGAKIPGSHPRSAGLKAYTKGGERKLAVFFVE